MPSGCNKWATGRRGVDPHLDIVFLQQQLSLLVVLTATYNLARSSAEAKYREAANVVVETTCFGSFFESFIHLSNSQY
ncbi:hypothetical protein LXL04_025472 [Taraxacum kok-saghyz]